MISSRSILRIAAFVQIATMIAACASPSALYDRRAVDHGIEKSTVWGDGFRHALYVKRGSPNTYLHVYLEGDGTPYHGGRFPAQDPTPTRPIVLELMALDPGPAVLVGRPCYHGLHGDVECRNSLWTDERYGESVVKSMVHAIENLARGQRIVLVGFSGGGALALLVASRLPCPTAIVTLGAIVDTEAWTRLHRYRRLSSSINPASVAGRLSDIRQVHLAGEKDSNVPPWLIERALEPDLAPEILAGVTHDRGWERHWPRMLARLKGMEEYPAIQNNQSNRKAIVCSDR